LSNKTVATTLLTILILCIGGAIDAATRGVADPIRGGKMWDKWWVMNGVTPPQTNHPLYPTTSQQSGPNTYRCKECHGWDYKGVDGAYNSGSHYTGIRGVFGSTMSPADMFDLLKLDTIANGHGYANYGMSDQDILDIVEFVQNYLIDTDLYIDTDGIFSGDEAQGQYNFTQGAGGTLQCTMCHGPDGDWINFGTPELPEWVGTVADHNPWELMHKIRFGQPATSMPSWIENGGTTQGVADIGVYAQINFPSVLCQEDINGDNLIGVSDLLSVIDQWGLTNSPADVNQDGIVNVSDLLSVVGNWGPCE